MYQRRINLNNAKFFKDNSWENFIYKYNKSLTINSLMEE